MVTFADIVADNGVVHIIDLVLLPATSSISDINITTGTSKQLVKVIDILGKEVKNISNQLLFYIFDDGTIEKKYIIK